MNTTRKPGFYWVKWDDNTGNGVGDWMIAEWVKDDLNHWYVVGNTFRFEDKDFTEINEMPICTPSVEAEDFEAEARRIYPYNPEASERIKIVAARKAHVFARQMSLNQHKAEGVFNGMAGFVVSRFPEASASVHLLKLKQEVDEAIADPTDTMEYADLLLCLFGAAHKAGITFDQLLTAASEKLEICKHRTWEKLLDGTYQHTSNEPPQSPPIDPLKAREIAEKAILYFENKSIRGYDIKNYLDIHYPLPSPIQETDTETDHEDPDLENAIK